MRYIHTEFTSNAWSRDRAELWSDTAKRSGHRKACGKACGRILSKGNFARALETSRSYLTNFLPSSLRYPSMQECNPYLNTLLLLTNALITNMNVTAALSYICHSQTNKTEYLETCCKNSTFESSLQPKMLFFSSISAPISDRFVISPNAAFQKKIERKKHWIKG